MESSAEQRFCELYERLEQPLYNTVYRWLWHREDAQDIVQQAFIACWQQRQDWRGDDLKPYVFSIALNLTKKRRRWQAIRHWVGLEKITDTLFEDLPEAYAEQANLRRSLEQMPAKLRETLLLVDVGGLSYAETATALNISQGTVGSRRNRALAWLQHHLNEDGVER